MYLLDRNLILTLSEDFMHVFQTEITSVGAGRRYKLSDTLSELRAHLKKKKKNLNKTCPVGEEKRIHLRLFGSKGL